jgi:hypothetical protein
MAVWFSAQAAIRAARIVLPAWWVSPAISDERSLSIHMARFCRIGLWPAFGLSRMARRVTQDLHESPQGAFFCFNYLNRRALRALDRPKAKAIGLSYKDGSRQAKAER